TTVPQSMIVSSSSSYTYLSFFLYSPAHHRDLHSFPTRRSSDLLRFMKRPARVSELDVVSFSSPPSNGFCWWGSGCNLWPSVMQADRKSTRLNSSHLVISYAVFCLKKKNKKNKIIN